MSGLPAFAKTAGKVLRSHRAACVTEKTPPEPGGAWNEDELRIRGIERLTMPRSTRKFSASSKRANNRTRLILLSQSLTDGSD
uniref:hypothetical protein n=1 Tax=Burkholderia diffusa TaxID=488732 RepID=UPI001CC50E8E|nr:hypothetical protein [Burkholderia diffusa]